MYGPPLYCKNKFQWWDWSTLIYSESLLGGYRFPLYDEFRAEIYSPQSIFYRFRHILFAHANSDSSFSALKTSLCLNTTQTIRASLLANATHTTLNGLLALSWRNQFSNIAPVFPVWLRWFWLRAWTSFSGDYFRLITVFHWLFGYITTFDRLEPCWLVQITSTIHCHFFQPFVSGFYKSKLLFDDPKWMFNLRLYAGF